MLSKQKQKISIIKNKVYYVNKVSLNLFDLKSNFSRNWFQPKAKLPYQLKLFEIPELHGKHVRERWKEYLALI